MDIPRGFEADIRRIQQLEDQSQRDPRAFVLLIQVCKQIIERLRPTRFPIFYSAIQTYLGNAYRGLPMGDQTANLVLAIQCYQEALRFYSLEAEPLAYAGIQNNLGVAYSDLPTGDRAANLLQAIGCYNQALLVWTPEAAPFGYAMAQHNLGVAYKELLTGDRSANLAQAIACYQKALRFSTPEAAPLDYALVQHNLGEAYRELPTGDRVANLTQAIRCYKQALRFRTPEDQPSAYAATQNNLGLAYRDLPTGDRSANLAQAIECYRQALRFYTPEDQPLKHALVQHNLGEAYYELPTGDRAVNLAKAIECYRQALRFRTPEGQPFAYAGTQNNLGEVYRELPTGDRAANLAKAIECFQQALRFYTPEASPLDFAMTQNNLGNAYGELPIGDRAANLAKAIRCYRQALRFYTPETEPLMYARIQNNLGGAYAELSTGDQAANLAKAIECFQQALRFYTPEAEPFQCRLTAHNLANLYFDQGEWEAALQAYHVAMDVGEQLYRVGLSAQSKAAEVYENADIYPHAAFAAVRCGKAAEGLLMLEQGKTRLLADALRLRVRRPPHVPDEIWNAFEQSGVALRAEQAEKPLVVPQNRDLVEIYEEHVRAVHAASKAFDASIERIRAYAPHFLEGTDFSTVEAQFSDKRMALIAFCITKLGSMGFIVSQHDQTEIQVVEVPTFTQTDLRRLFVERDTDRQPIGGWLGAYYRSLLNRSAAVDNAWPDTIKRVLADLGERLLTPIISALPAEIERIIFLPSAELFLFPLHAVPLFGRETTLLCDRYEISYAPSLEVLAHARASITQKMVPALYAVINPEEDLLFAPTEGAAIARLFAQCIVDTGRVGTKERVLAGMREQTYIHFSCHGSYDWNNPPDSKLHLAGGYLTLADLQQGDVDLSTARLVTLSACETGITDVVRGSAGEYVGIPAGFLLAGVPCVVGSLWEVQDLSTTLLMEHFYQNHLQGGMAFATALREAQRWICRGTAKELALADKWQQIYQSSRETNMHAFRQMRYYRSNPEIQPFAHPYYWAAFTINGM